MINRTDSSISGAKPARAARILLLDEHVVVRQGIAQLINGQPDMRVVAEASDLNTAFLIIRQESPDLVLLDLNLRDGAGLELIQRIRVRHPDIPMLVLTTMDETVFGPSALRAGARGYVMKDEPVSTLLLAIRRTLSGSIHLSNNMRTRTIQYQIQLKDTGSGSPVELLSRREKQVFQMIAQWRRPSEIAQALCVSVKTVSTYREKIKEKLNLQTGSQLAQFATEWYRTHGRMAALNSPVPPPTKSTLTRRAPIR